jgi:anti-sigma regulatory factor (Ser/Thr protein kinase)
MSHSLHLSIENNDRGLAGAAEKIAEFLLAAGVSEEMTHDIRLAAEELLTNICKYAYVDVDEHSILLDISVGADGATLRLSDDGMEFSTAGLLHPAGREADRRSGDPHRAESRREDRVRAGRGKKCARVVLSTRLSPGQGVKTWI